MYLCYRNGPLSILRMENLIEKENNSGVHLICGNPLYFTKKTRRPLLLYFAMKFDLYFY